MSCDREDESGRARDVADHGQARARSLAQARIAAVTSAASPIGSGTFATTTRAPARSATKRSGIEAGVVLVVRRQDLVAGLELERAEDRVDAGRGVGHERDVVGVGVDQAGKRGARAIEMPFELSVQELDRVALHARAPFGLVLQHGPRARSERAMVEVRDRQARAASSAGSRRSLCEYRWVCGRMTMRTNPSELAEIFDAELRDSEAETLDELGPRYNVAPTQDIPVIVQRDDGRAFEMHRWGIVPSWSEVGRQRRRAATSTRGPRRSRRARSFATRSCAGAASSRPMASTSGAATASARSRS